MKKIGFAMGFIVSNMLLLNAQQIQFEEYDLENGLHFILQEDHSNPIVTVSVLYHVGSKNEEANRTGFAHFFEHLLFEGSKNIKRGEFSQYVENNGGVLNANTSKDRTYYYETLPSNQLALGLWLESERMLQAKVENAGIETQREVVKEEKRLRMDNQPYMTAFRKEIWEYLFPTHPYNWAVIGSIEDLNAAQEIDYKNFYATYYVPNNATLSIAGDINPSEAKKLIKDYFGTIPRGTKTIHRPNVTEKPITKEIVITSEDNNAQLPALIIAYRTPKQTDKDAYVLDIISNVLSNGESSRITKNVVNNKQLALASGSFLYGLEDYGSFFIFAMPNQGIEMDKLLEAIDFEVDNLVNNGISERELQTQINKLEKQFVSTNATTAGIAENLADYHVYFGDANLINTEIDRYRAITVDDVTRVAKKYLNKNQRIRMNVVSKK
ncbi:MAG: M16 family metallopeptidase [Flavobacteriales bacterium]